MGGNRANKGEKTHIFICPEQQKEQNVIHLPPPTPFYLLCFVPAAEANLGKLRGLPELSTRVVGSNRTSKGEKHHVFHLPEQTHNDLLPFPRPFCLSVSFRQFIVALLSNVGSVKALPRPKDRPSCYSAQKVIISLFWHVRTLYHTKKYLQRIHHDKMPRSAMSYCLINTAPLTELAQPKCQCLSCRRICQSVSLHLLLNNTFIDVSNHTEILHAYFS